MQSGCMEHPVDIGDRTTLALMSVLRERGFGVLMPFGENTRYDLVIDEAFRSYSLYNYCSPVSGEHFFAGVAQLVEQLIRNQQVSGSSPLAGF